MNEKLNIVLEYRNRIPCPPFEMNPIFVAMVDVLENYENRLNELEKKLGEKNV